MPHIAIAGAGIGGLAAALALADAGQRVTLYERLPALGEAGAGLQLSPNACAALRSLGVLDEVETDAVALQALRIGRGRDGAILARLPLGDTIRTRFGAPFLVTRRADLHLALRRRVETSPKIALVLGAQVTGWTRTPAGLCLSVADPGGADVEVDALVGADGLRSSVRATLAGQAGRLRYRGTAWRTTIDAATAPSFCREAASNLWLGRGAHVVHYPVARGRLINVIAAIDHASALEGLAGTHRATTGDPAKIAARFSSWSAPIRRLIASGGPWGTWPLVDLAPLQSWSAGPVTLLGDAAHPMLPFLAQGAAQSLEDAVALGRAVAGSPQNPAAAFRNYEMARRARATRVQNESRRQAKIYHLPAPASSLRDVVLRMTPPEKLLARYDWVYSHSGSDEVVSGI